MILFDVVLFKDQETVFFPDPDPVFFFPDPGGRKIPRNTGKKAELEGTFDELHVPAPPDDVVEPDLVLPPQLHAAEPVPLR